MNNRKISSRIIKELYAKSGNSCAFTNCNEQLFDNANIGEICHIQGLNPGSARYNPDLSEEEVNSIDNLILLCSNHHKMIDQQEDLFPKERLLKMKKMHEDLICNNIKKRNERRLFFYELQKIFQENNFDKYILEQGYDGPFEDSVFMYIDIGCEQIYNLLNTEYAISLSGQEKKKYIHLFIC